MVAGDILHNLTSDSPLGLISHATWSLSLPSEHTTDSSLLLGLDYPPSQKPVLTTSGLSP